MELPKVNLPNKGLSKMKGATFQNMLRICLGFFFVAVDVGCGPKGNQPNVELIQDMMVSPALKAQRNDPFFSDEIGLRLPPANTRPIGYKPYKFSNDINGAEKDLKNPFGGDKSAAVLSLGQKYYETYCMVCHGQTGKGDGNV